MAITVKNFAAQVEIKDPQTSGRLTIYPVFAAKQTGQPGPPGEEPRDHRPLHYLLLEEALDQGSFEIGEVSTSGEVNTVIINNMTGAPVLILDGEEILGAKQNRMVNATILVATGKKTAVPVSCVEQGRWDYSTDKFGKSDAFGYSTLRRQKAEQVRCSLETNTGFNTDQSAIWEEIDRSSKNLGTESPTGAMHETYSRREGELRELVDSFEYIPGQVGVVVYINNRFSCLDLFDKSKTLEKLWTRLLKSYALEALNTRGRSLKKPRPEPEELKKAIEESEYLTYPSVSMGQDLRLSGPGITGAGLIVEEELIHLSIFPATDKEKQSRSNIRTPRQRRRGMKSDDVIY